MEAIARRLFGCESWCDQDKEEIHMVKSMPTDTLKQPPKAGLDPDDLPGPSLQRNSAAAGPGTVLDPRQEMAPNGKDVKDLFRLAVGGGNDRETKVNLPSPKSLDDIKLMVAAVKSNRNLQTVLTMEDKLCNAMIEMAWKEEVPAGVNVIEQGDLDSDYFYIVKEGTVEVFVKGVQVLRIGKGGSFGELALLYYAPRAATVRTSTDSVFWVIDRSHFKAILNRTTEEHLQQFVKHMHHMDRLEKLPKKVRMEIANSLEEFHFNEGDIVYRFGEPCDSFWFFIEGMLDIEKKGKTERVRGAGDHPVVLGDNAMGNDPGLRKETAVIASETAVGVTINRLTFDMLMKKVEIDKENVKRAEEGFKSLKFGSDFYDTENFRQSHKDHIRLKDLQIKGTLGLGGFGLVELAYHKLSDKTYALKTISKGYVQKAGLQSNVLNEKSCQFQCDCPFIVKLVETFSTTQTLGFLQEVMLGGDLLETYRREKLWGKANYAKFFIAGVVLAFEHMHAKKIIYRDLKPENVLIDTNGYPKLTDLGWAKVAPGMTYTLCGSLVSMAPEVIKASGHNRGADWWTLGIMAYELLARETPFQADTPTGIYSKIFAGIRQVDFSKPVLTGDVEDIIKSLCNPLMTERLPMRYNGTVRFRKHAWYQGFDWAALENLHFRAPFIPTVEGKFDLSNFRSDIKPEIPMVSVPLSGTTDEDGVPIATGRPKRPSLVSLSDDALDEACSKSHMGGSGWKSAFVSRKSVAEWDDAFASSC